MITTITWPSPAKLNLFLYINGRRDDGYHELQTLFQFLDYGDQLTISSNTSGDIQLEVKDAKALQALDPEQNLIIKAVRALQQATDTKMGANIVLNKVLPMGGGLGGGSSNAATLLVALNYQWQLGLSVDQLANIGLTLGADVPVFVRGHAAFAEGVGEELQPVSPTEYYYLVVTPNVEISTATLFNAPELPRNTKKMTWDQHANAVWSNDCEKTACLHYPEVGNKLAWMLNFAPSRMTGTGSCLFARFDTAKAAERVMQQLPGDEKAFIAKGINRSPLLSKLAELGAC